MASPKATTEYERNKQLEQYLAETYMNLGNIYKSKSNYEKAESFYNKSAKHLKKSQRRNEVLTESKVKLPEGPPLNEKEIEAMKKLQEAERRMEEDKQKWQRNQPAVSHYDHYISKLSSMGAHMGAHVGNLVLRATKDEPIDEEPKTIAEIGLPTNVVHQGHIGFASGGFQTFNLPAEYKTLFDNLNQTLKSMGVEEITEKEAKLLLRSIPLVMSGKKTAPSQKTATIKNDLDEDSFENIEDAAVLQKQIKKLREELRLRDQEKAELEKQKRSLEAELSSALGGSTSKSSTPNTDRALPKPAKKAEAVQSPPPPPPMPSAPPPPPTKSTLNTKEKKEVKKPVAEPRDALLSAIKTKQTLKHVEDTDKGKHAVDADDANVLNLIAKALITRRHNLKEEDEDEEDNLEEWL